MNQITPASGKACDSIRTGDALDAQAVVHNEKGIDLLVSLLQTLAAALGYDFNQVQLKRGAYLPQGHADDGQARIAIRDGLVKLLSGQQTIKMDVISFPLSQEALVRQQEVQDALLRLLSGECALKVQND